MRPSRPGLLRAVVMARVALGPGCEGTAHCGCLRADNSKVRANEQQEAGQPERRPASWLRMTSENSYKVADPPKVMASSPEPLHAAARFAAMSRVVIVSVPDDVANDPVATMPV